MPVEQPKTRDLRERIGVVKGINAEQRTVTGYASTGEIDRYGEIVSPKAFEYDLDRFLKERHLFAAGHQYVNYKGEPTIIGKITEAKIDKNGLFITAQFDTDDLAELWWQKYASKTLNAFSIGFIPVKWEDTEQVVGKRTTRIRTYTEVELLEISAVPIPANRESMVTNAFASPEQIAELLKKLEASASTRLLPPENGSDDIQKELTELRNYVQQGFGQILGQLGVLARNSAHAGLAHNGCTGSEQGNVIGQLNSLLQGKRQ